MSLSILSYKFIYYYFLTFLGKETSISMAFKSRQSIIFTLYELLQYQKSKFEAIIFNLVKLLILILLQWIKLFFIKYLVYGFSWFPATFSQLLNNL